MVNFENTKKKHNNKPLLSICIPTFNRVSFLEETIGLLVAQEKFKDGTVEIVISDNCSDDGTKELMESIVSDYPDIKYYRNEENLRGMNFVLALQRGTGLYRLLANDYIVYNKSALEIMTCIINYYRDDKPVLFWNIKPMDSVIQRVHSLDEFVCLTSFSLTWVASVGVWENEADGLIDNWKDNNKTNFSKIILNDTNRYVNYDYFWHARYDLQSVYDKGDAVVINIDHIFSGRSLFRKIPIDHYNFVYGEYFMSILYEYRDIGALTDETCRWVKKDLLYNFFKPNMKIYDLKTGELEFQDNVKEKILSLYKDEDYYDDFLREYNYEIRVYYINKVREPIKNLLKTILGRKKSGK